MPARKTVKTEITAEGKDVVLNAETPADSAPDQAAAEKPSEKKPAAAKKTTSKKPAERKTAVKKTTGKKPDTSKAKETASAASAVPSDSVPGETVQPATEKETAEMPAAAEAVPAPEAEVSPEVPAEETVPAAEESQLQPRRSVAFIGAECYPFVKTGGLGDVMYALPRALVKQNCDVKVILPRYRCIPQKYQDKMIYRGDFYMDLCSDGRRFYVGIMEYVWDGVVYDFIDNEDFFSYGNPYTNLVDDIPRFCYFSKAALAALNYLDWVPDIIHCHDWQAALVPVYLRTQFAGTPVASAKSILTIHNMRFQGAYGVPMLRYWTGLPDSLLNSLDVFKEGWDGANSMKAGLAYADRITTVSPTYAYEIQTPFYGDGLDAHLRHHSWKLRGIVNGIDCDQWDPAADMLIDRQYTQDDAPEQKAANKAALQAELGLDQNPDVMVFGLVSRLTDQKGLDLLNAIVPAIIDGNTQLVVLGTGDPSYENGFRQYEEQFKGAVCSNIMYDEARAHRIYAGSDALLIPSLFEPCGLTQLIAMRFGTIPVIRETGGLRDTVAPYNQFTGEGNGFTFDRYEAGLLLDAVNRAKDLYFNDREAWNAMLRRDMEKDVSWDVPATEYRALYLELKP